MTIQEILETHVVEVGRNVFTLEEWLRCKCGWIGARVLAEGFDWEPAKRDHVADVIAEHMHEQALQAQVNVLNGVASAWEEMGGSGATLIHARMLRETAKRIGAEPSGR
ncbi:hypothetical protein [Glutamicibacter ardleyensis]|uniref:hypothetical protein n=1 Tax=Glutamicibacter ardleyensis TaxID=225894 RepID=UPI003FD48813